MPFNKELKNDSDIEDIMMYELVNMLQMNFAEIITNKYKDKLFDYYMKGHKKHVEDQEQYAVQCFIESLIKESDSEQRYQLVYDSVEDDADEFMRGILEGLSQKEESFCEMMDRINDEKRGS